MMQHRTKYSIISMLCAVSCVAFARSAAAQQSFHMPAATQPSPGTLLVRPLAIYSEYDDDVSGLNREIEELQFAVDLAFGLSKETAIAARIPYIHRDVDRPGNGSDDDDGLGDVELTFKWRFVQNDTGPINTERLSLLLGAELPTGSDPFGSSSFDPMVGLAYTSVHDRHGFNWALRYTFTTGQRDHVPIGPGETTADLLRYDVGYLYRLSPAEYAADTHGSLYAMVEFDGLYETNGDNELFISPGLMYEARQWALEASLQVPVWQDLDHRPEVEYIVGVGFRWLF